MKRAIIIIGLLFGFMGAQAQTKTTKTGKTTKTEKVNDADLDCYSKWVKKFKDRGANDVTDGTYKDVIIVVREGTNSDCYEGKAVVDNLKVTNFAILLEDGTYGSLPQLIKPESKKDVPIVNGMSKAMVTTDNKHVYILWPKSIKPKPAPFKKAPEPTDD